jgi:hypothetical protein
VKSHDGLNEGAMASGGDVRIGSMIVGAIAINAIGMITPSDAADSIGTRHKP